MDAEDREVDKTIDDHDQLGRVGHRDRARSRARAATRPSRAARSTSTGREASGEARRRPQPLRPAGRRRHVNTKYNGTYNAAAARTPYGGWNTAVAGPYGGTVTTTLPSGYRTTTYYGRPYYTYGGAYYRPYMYRGVHYYYPVPAAVLRLLQLARRLARRF